MPALLLALGILALFMTVLFVIATVRKNNGIADIGYGCVFIVLVLSTLYITHNTQYQSVLLAALVLVWGARLATRIALKNHGKPEDFRYKAWRDAWGNWFLVRSFLQIYMLQGAIVFIIALPVTLSIAYPAVSIYTTFVFVGVLVWCIGFFFETVGDYQLDRFIKDPANKGKIMMSGLWYYTRHPNYFGESLMWWGLWIACIGTTDMWPIAIASPILITYLLRYVSGVPMLEKRWEGNPTWEAYKAKTPAMIPSIKF